MFETNADEPLEEMQKSRRLLTERFTTSNNMLQFY